MRVWLDRLIRRDITPAEFGSTIYVVAEIDLYISLGARNSFIPVDQAMYLVEQIRAAVNVTNGIDGESIRCRRVVRR